MPDITLLAKQFRADIISGEASVSLELTQQYAIAAVRISREIGRIEGKIKAAIANGKQINQAWLFRQGRLEALLVQVDEEIKRIAARAKDRITAEQARAVDAAQENTERLVRLSLGTVATNAIERKGFNSLNTRSTEELVGRLGDGTPLERLLREIAPETVQNIKDVLVNAMVQGQNPKLAARLMKAEENPLIPGLNRLVAISRTSILTSYRAASIATYRENSGLVEAWMWWSELDFRTCAVCISMHGSIHPLDEEFGSHVMCRCVPIPVTVPYSELGIYIPETQLPIVDGADWFDAQSESDQKRILTPGKYKLFKESKITLKDIVGIKHDPDWGIVRFEKSLKSLVDH